MANQVVIQKYKKLECSSDSSGIMSTSKGAYSPDIANGNLVGLKSF